MEFDFAGSRDASEVGRILMFSKEYLNQLSAKTGFHPDRLQKQMALLDLPRQVNGHPSLRSQFGMVEYLKRQTLEA